MKNQENWKPTKVRFNNVSGLFELNPGGIYGGSYHIAAIQIKAYIPLLKKHLNGNMLDCGCGQVPFYQVYKDQVKSVTCIDWDKSNQFLDQVVDLNDRLPFKDNEFDSILISDVISHIKKPEFLFAELARILKPGGRILVFSPFLYWLCETPHDFQRLTEFAYQEFCSNNKLTVLKLDAYGGRIDALIDLINKKFTRGLLQKLLIQYSKFVLNTGYYNKSVQRTKKLFPIGYYLVAQK